LLQSEQKADQSQVTTTVINQVEKS
jgi:hypothetical protein